MIKFEKTEVHGLEPALRGMRNPLDSWAKSDSFFSDVTDEDNCIGNADAELASRLIKSGTEHCKFLRQIVCWVDITAPRFWWMEFDTYRHGVEKNSCSTMHTIMKREFTPDDFTPLTGKPVIDELNGLRQSYLDAKDDHQKKLFWRALIEKLPQGYMQKRTVMMSYQAIRAMCHQRKGHKLSEWHDFIDWAKTLPESWMLINDD